MERLEALLMEFGDDLREIGITAVYLEASQDRPIPSLVVSAPPYDDGAPRSVTLAFVPDDEELEYVDLLQLFIPLPLAADEIGSEAGIARRLMGVNKTAVLGHAGITDDGELYWRHIWPIPQGLPIVASVMFEVLSFFVFSAELALDALRAPA
ncbi:MAG: hypothetical protein R6X34_15460 [Chloroflexota bacterium]